jgi:molecular chaperone DnaK (HSP70)
MTKDNNKLGEFTLEGIPPAPRGVPQIKVIYDINADGILTVSASVGSGEGKSLTIQKEKGRMSEAEIKRMVDDAEKYKEIDAKRRECMEAKNQYENTLYSAKNMLDGEEAKSVPDDKKSEIRTYITDELSWLGNQGNDTEAEEFKNRLSKFQTKIQTMMTSGTTEPSSTQVPKERDPDIVEID